MINATSSNTKELQQLPDFIARGAWSGDETSVIMDRPKASALSAIETNTGFARVCYNRVIPSNV